jgi:5-methylcytosine-specific restriction endonuclease McrA
MTGQMRPTDFYTDHEVIERAEFTRRKGDNYPDVYFLRRREVFRRDRYTCTECGYRSQRQRGEVHDIECHHIAPDGGHELTNLRTVCIACHQKLTAGRPGRSVELLT